MDEDSFFVNIYADLVAGSIWKAAEEAQGTKNNFRHFRKCKKDYPDD
ncbi:MAG: hypothetical protein R6W96_10150 [Clostridia bacterium]